MIALNDLVKYILKIALYDWLNSWFICFRKMSTQVLFDPHKLNEEQKSFLMEKLNKASSAPNQAGCRTFLPKARTSNGRYGKIKTRADVGRLFGHEARTYNASKLLYCLHKDVIWFKQMGNECSHLCGYDLCMELSHINFESHSINSNRKKHHKSKVCSGHGENPDCVIR